MYEYMKEDWTVRLPEKLRTNHYIGANRTCYAMLCVFWYLIKTFFLFTFYFLYRFYRLIFWDCWMRIGDEYQKNKKNSDVCEAKEYEDCDYTEELPFCQLFELSDEMCLLVDHVEMCPDETAFIRIIDENDYTPLRKSKVYKDEKDGRFIIFDDRVLYLDDQKTDVIAD